MVKRLFKHEVLSYLRTVLPMHMVLLGIALLSRIIQLFDNNSTAYEIIFWSSVVAFIVGCMVCYLLTVVFGIKRFYTNMFTSEGYLTLTLPVTPHQHILVKNVVAVLTQISSLIMILISTCVIMFGDVCIEAFKAAGYLLKLLYREYNYHASIYIFEFVVALVVYFSASYLLYYACIALGQRSKKNRVGAAVGVFFIYYLIVQVIGTTISILTTVYYEFFEKIIRYLSKHPTFTIHLVLIAVIVISAVLSIICYAITKRTITKKLNLE